MAESYTAEELAECRANLHAFRHSIGIVDDDEFTTTLHMQEQWLETVDEGARQLVGVIKQLQGYARDAHTFRGLRTRKCLRAWGLNDQRACSYHFGELRQYCAPCYLRAIHKPVTEITELELHSISLDSDKPHGPKPPFPGSATGMRTPEAIAKEFHDMTEALVEEPPERERGEKKPEENQELVDEFLREVRREDAKTAREKDCVCKGGFVDYLGPPCPVHPIPDEGEPISEHRIRPMPPCDDRSECEVAGHIWVKMGKVGLDDHGLSAMDWGETKCLRCNEPYDVGFDTE